MRAASIHVEHGTWSMALLAASGLLAPWLLLHLPACLPAIMRPAWKHQARCNEMGLASKPCSVLGYRMPHRKASQHWFACVRPCVGCLYRRA